MFALSRTPLGPLAGQRPVVVMARGHSGTRVLAWALQKLGVPMGAIPEVPTGDVQDRRFTRVIKRICRASLRQPVTAPPNPRLLRIFQQAVHRYLQWLGQPAGSWGWKFPETYLIPHYVAASFPLARHLHMVRDGRDVAFKQHLTDDPHRRLGRRLLRQLAVLDKAHPIQAAISWEFQVRRYDAFLQAAQPTVHTIAFESLCRDPLATMQGVCDFLGCEMTPECRAYLEGQVNPQKIAQFRHEDPRQIAEVEAAIAPTLARLGYLTGAA